MKKLLAIVLVCALAGCGSVQVEANSQIPNKIIEKEEIKENQNIKDAKYIIKYFRIDGSLSPRNNFDNLRFWSMLAYTDKFEWLPNGVLHYTDCVTGREKFLKSPVIEIEENYYKK